MNVPFDAYVYFCSSFRYGNENFVDERHRHRYEVCILHCNDNIPLSAEHLLPGEKLLKQKPEMTHVTSW